ncbi:hypothetical protein B0H13DRAFT_2306766 [Mycena leptocephala]|nr:hypothetical protein B0H13DRAFT_2306766 [Mycena leptocephala]
MSEIDPFLSAPAASRYLAALPSRTATSYPTLPTLAMLPRCAASLSPRPLPRHRVVAVKPALATPQSTTRKMQREHAGNGEELDA